jgi:hypothetical protein
MLIAALVCGLVTAYYFGVKAGTYAAGASAALFFVGTVIPGWSSWAYALIALQLIGVCFLGPRMGKPLGQRKAILAVRIGISKLRNRFR